MDGAGGREVRARAPVFRANRALALVAWAAFAASLALLGLWWANLASFGFVGVYGAIGALWLRRVILRRNVGTRARVANVRVTAEGVYLDDALAIPRARIAAGYFETRRSMSGNYVSHVRLVDKRRRVLADLDIGGPEARGVLEVLGLDAGQQRVDFRAVSGMPLPLRIVVFAVLGLAWMALGPMLWLFALAPIASLLLVPSTIVVGVDGILYKWLWQRDFIPMGQVQDVLPEGDGNIRVRLTTGKEHLFEIARRGRSPIAEAEILHRDAILRRIDEARRAFQARAASADVAALVGQNGRTADDWIAALRGLAAKRGYRDVALRDGDLLDVVENPSATEDARAGAALLLKGSLDDEGKKRVRIASSATASPRLRVALDAVAEDVEDQAVARAMLGVAKAEKR